MVWEDVRWKDALKTIYMPGVPKDVQIKRKALIEEAMSWAGGSQADPKRIFINPCSDGTAVYFEKPGKEAVTNAKGKVKNPNDMRPIVELNGKQPKNASFTDVWSDLTEIAYADMGAFRAILLLIYRSAFLVDHRFDDDMHLRYLPDEGIMSCIEEMNSLVGEVVSLKSVERLLRFIDVLGWNEDVKYIEKNKNGIERTGRINTLLTCIKIPHDTVTILKRHDEWVRLGKSESHMKDGENTSHVPLYNIMQTLLRTRGVCVPSTGELFELFNPHLVDGSRVHKSSGTVGLRSIQQTIV